MQSILGAPWRKLRDPATKFKTIDKSGIRGKHASTIALKAESSVSFGIFTRGDCC